MAADKIGMIPMPADFKYKDVFLKGMPEHKPDDEFRLKHPPMTAAKWAKIFSPFDALKGFSEALEEKDIVYVPRAEPNDDLKHDLDQKLERLHSFTWNSQLAKKNNVTVTMKVFFPHSDHSASGDMGQYRILSGIVLQVDTEVTKTLTLQNELGKFTVSFHDIDQIDNDTGIFDFVAGPEAP